MWTKRWNNGYLHAYSPFDIEPMHTITTFVEGDSERFGSYSVKFTRCSKKTSPAIASQPDPIQIEITDWNDTYRYTIDGRDLCYAIAKACTEAIKKYGLRGYRQITGSNYTGDTFDLDELLFVKAYALGCIDVRYTKELWEIPGRWIRAGCSAFEKELELLLFDM